LYLGKREEGEEMGVNLPKWTISCFILLKFGKVLLNNFKDIWISLLLSGVGLTYSNDTIETNEEIIVGELEGCIFGVEVGQ
jgi:hypothetical protein